jgi:D-alanyl-D-alanine carboxypeptidase
VSTARSDPPLATRTTAPSTAGAFALDELLVEFVRGRWRGCRGAEVTIRALLSHRSGLPNYTDIDEAISDALADRSRQFTPDEIVGYVNSVPPSAADQRFAYSNTNYILLGQLVEQLDGTDLNTALRNRITGPLRLAATRFATGDDPTPDGLAAGWSPGILDGDPDADYTSIASGAWAAGALVSTVGELATFLAALFAGNLISAESLTAMTSTGPEGYGLGLGAAGFGLDQSGYGHGGAIFGYTTIMAIDPATGDAVIIATNNDELVADELAAQVVEHW